MSDKQTQEVKIMHPRKKSWFGCWGSPDVSTVVVPKGMIQPIDSPSKATHAIGRSIPKSVDEQAGFGF
jgi:hypothetical protein